MDKLSSWEVPCLQPLLVTGHQTWKFWSGSWREVLPQRHRHTPSQREYPLTHWFLLPVLVRWLPAMCWLPPKLLRGRGLWGEGGGLPCSPAALPTSSISEFCGAPEVLCLLTAQLHFAQVSPTESQQQEIARQDEKCSKSPKEGGHCLELLQRSLKRSSRRGTPCR